MHERRAGTAAATHASHTPHRRREGRAEAAKIKTAPVGDCKPRHAAISERETNAKRRKQAARVYPLCAFSRLYPHLFHIFQNAPQCPKFCRYCVFSRQRYIYTTHTPNAARAHFAQSRLYNLHNTRRTCTILTFS